MVCRRCKRDVEHPGATVCPHCGGPLAPSGVLKTSTILIAEGGRSSVYHSVTEVPAPLLRKLRKSTNGANSATILIADQRGREEIDKAMRRLPKSVQRRLKESASPENEEAPVNQLLSATQYRWIALGVAILGVILFYVGFLKPW